MLPGCRAQNCAPSRARSCTQGRVRRGAAWRTTMAVVLAGLFAASCDDPPPPKAPTAASSAPAKATLAELPPQMVAAVSGGRNTEMISVHFALRAAPAVGQPLPVDIAIVPHRSFKSIRAVFQGPESLGLSTGNHFEHLKEVGSEVVLKHNLSLLPTQEGLFLLTAAVDTEDEDGQLTRVYSMPVIIHSATAPAKPAGNPPPATPTG